MKLNRIFLALVFTVALALPAVAQNDTFGQLRTLLVTPPTAFTVSTTVVTNGPFDMKEFSGIAKADVLFLTNSATTQATLQFFGSSTGTNSWAALANYANATKTSLLSTNVSSGAGTNIYNVFTNTLVLPGAIVNPTASSAGWATPYLDQAPFTNSAALIVTNGQAIYSIGYNVDDAPRFLQAVWTLSGSNTNGFGAITLTTRHAARGF